MEKVCSRTNILTRSDIRPGGYNGSVANIIDWRWHVLPLHERLERETCGDILPDTDGQKLSRARPIGCRPKTTTTATKYRVLEMTRMTSNTAGCIEEYLGGFFHVSIKASLSWTTGKYSPAKDHAVFSSQTVKFRTWPVSFNDHLSKQPHFLFYFLCLMFRYSTSFWQVWITLDRPFSARKNAGQSREGHE